jgi:hypothetical protein
MALEGDVSRSLTLSARGSQADEDAGTQEAGQDDGGPRGEDEGGEDEVAKEAAGKGRGWHGGPIGVRNSGR